MLVQRHVDALAAAADGNARIHLALLDALGQRMAKVTVVARLLGVRAIVLVLIALLFKILLDELLQSKASVIAGESYCLNFHIISY